MRELHFDELEAVSGAWPSWEDFRSGVKIASGVFGVTLGGIAIAGAAGAMAPVAIVVGVGMIIFGSLTVLEGNIELWNRYMAQLKDVVQQAYSGY